MSSQATVVVENKPSGSWIGLVCRAVLALALVAAVIALLSTPNGLGPAVALAALILLLAPR